METEIYEVIELLEEAHDGFEADATKAQVTLDLGRGGKREDEIISWVEELGEELDKICGRLENFRCEAARYDNWMGTK